MTAEIPIQVNERVVKYVEAQAIKKQQSRAEALASLIDEWYEVMINQLYQRYLAGDLTLRGMAQQLGLNYRELYQMLEERDLNF
jgi:hypothetical protein